MFLFLEEDIKDGNWTQGPMDKLCTAFMCIVLGGRLRALRMLGKRSTTELSLESDLLFEMRFCYLSRLASNCSSLPNSTSLYYHFQWEILWKMKGGHHGRTGKALHCLAAVWQWELISKMGKNSILFFGVLRQFFCVTALAVLELTV